MYSRLADWTDQAPCTTCGLMLSVVEKAYRAQIRSSTKRLIANRWQLLHDQADAVHIDHHLPLGRLGLVHPQGFWSRWLSRQRLTCMTIMSSSTSKKTFSKLPAEARRMIHKKLCQLQDNRRPILQLCVRHSTADRVLIEHKAFSAAGLLHALAYGKRRGLGRTKAAGLSHVLPENSHHQLKLNLTPHCAGPWPPHLHSMAQLW